MDGPFSVSEFPLGSLFAAGVDDLEKIDIVLRHSVWYVPPLKV